MDTYVNTYLDKKWNEKEVRNIVLTKEALPSSNPIHNSSLETSELLNSLNSLLKEENQNIQREEESILLDEKKSIDNCKLKLNQIYEETKKKNNSCSSIQNSKNNLLHSSSNSASNSASNELNNNNLNNYVEVDIKDIIQNVVQNYKSITQLHNPLHNATFGIHKTIFTEKNGIFDSNRNSFRIESQSPSLYSSFYLYPSQTSFINKMDVNIIEEKKVDTFVNQWNPYDIQVFPLEYIPTGIFIPLVKESGIIKHIKIESIHWNIFQLENTSSSAIIGIVANQNHFVHKPISLELHFELHSQKKEVIEELYPYEKEDSKGKNASQTCIFPVQTVCISTMEGVSFEKIIWNIPEAIFNNLLLMVRVSVPSDSISILKGYDAYQQTLMGYIPFHQMNCFIEYSTY